MIRAVKLDMPNKNDLNTMDDLISKYSIPIKYGFFNPNCREDRINISNGDDWESKVNKWLDNKPNKKVYKKYNQYSLKDTNLLVIDFDNHENNGLTLDKVYEKFPFLIGCLYTISKNKKGYHFYSIASDKYANITKQLNTNKESGLDIDYLTNIVEEIDNVVINGELKEITDCELKEIYPSINKKIKELKEVKELPYDVKQKIYSINNKELIELVGVLKDQRADEYGDWALVVGALKSKDLKDAAINFSKRSSKYDSNSFELFYSTQKDLSIGIIHNMAKEDNIKAYREIRIKYRYDGLKLDLNDLDSAMSVAEKIEQYLKSNLVYCNKLWFTVKDNLWKSDITPDFYILKCIEIATDNAGFDISSKLNDTTCKDELTKISEDRLKLMKAKKQVCSTSSMSQIIKCLKEILCDNEFENTLDKNPYKFAFKNGIYDISTNTFRLGLDPSDFLTKTIDSDYTDDFNSEDEKWINDQLFKLCNCNEEESQYYLSILSYALCGDPSKYQHFYGAVGQKAGNGKSALLLALQKIMPNYVKIGNSQVLESDFKNKHKFIDDLERYRLIIYEEMRKGKKIDTRFFKIVSDGSNLDNEVMYATNKKVEICAKCILVSNHSPDFDEPDEGAKRRYQHFQFDNTFRPEYEDDFEKRQFKADSKFVDKLVARSDTLIKMLLRSANKVLIDGLPKEPELYAKEKKEVMALNFVFKSWINESCEFSDNFRVGKKELIDKCQTDCNIKLDEKSLKDDMKGLGFKYDWALRSNNNRGVFVGLRLKEEEPECLIED